MTPRRVAIVWNPVKADENDLRAALADHGADARWYPTSPDDPGQAAATAAVADGAEVVLVAGGDGTVRAVAEVLADSGIRLGIVPSGTGNLLARNLGIPVNSVRDAVEIGLGAEARLLDVGWAEIAGERHAFVVMAGFGIDSRMIVETDDDLKSKAGWLAYVAGLGKAIGSADVVPLSYRIDDATPVAAEAHTCIVGNCGSIQGGIQLLPDAAPDDGSLDVILLGADTLSAWVETLKTALWDNGVLRWFREEDAVSGEHTEHLRGTRIEITTGKPVTFEVDGDELGDVSHAVITVTPGSLDIAAPAAAA